MRCASVYIASISAMTSWIGRRENCCPLYVWQNAHLFHGQLRVTRINMLYASDGGLMGPNSNVYGMAISPAGLISISKKEKIFREIEGMLIGFYVQC